MQNMNYFYKDYTFPSLLKNFSRSLVVTLVDNPVTYKLFPGFDASTESRLLEQQKNSKYHYHGDMQSMHFIPVYGTINITSKQEKLNTYLDLLR